MSCRGRKPTISLNKESLSIEIPIFNYVPSEKCIIEISEFSYIHRKDTNKIFRAAWNMWIKTPEVADIIKEETSRIEEFGFNGDLTEKLYFSARYYYRKKALAYEKDDNLPQKKRKPNESTDKTILEQMNNHILEQMKKNNEIRPADSFKNYLLENPVNNENEEEKVKKTYKNRFFMIRTKLLQAN
jgi:hypothetical protein